MGVYTLYTGVYRTQGNRMATLSFRVDDALKESLKSEAMKEGISLSEYMKKVLEKGLVDVHISKTESNLSNSKAQIEKLAEISNEVINEVKRKIQMIGEDAEKNNYTKQLKKMYWILISVSILFGLISIPVLRFNIEYLNSMF